jgi:hypothetical protein
VEEESIEAVAVTSKTFTGMRPVEVEAIQGMLLPNTPLPNSSIRNIPTRRTVLHHNRKVQMMMAKIFSGRQLRTFRLRIRMRRRRKTKRRCHPQAGHLCRKHRTSKILRNSALLSRLHRKLPPQLQSPRSHRN